MAEKRKGLVGLTTFFAPAKDNSAGPPGKRAWQKWFAESSGMFAWLKSLTARLRLRKTSFESPLDNSGIPVG